MTEPSILIVEDELIIAEDLRLQLESAGYPVVGVVDTGEDAVQYVDREHPQLVLMDIKLAGKMDGIEAAGLIHEHHDVPVVYLTANKDRETISRAKVTEPYGYIGKPFSFVDIRSVIELAVYKHQADSRFRANERWQCITLNNIQDGVLTIDDQLRVAYLNPAGAKLTGWNTKDAIGRDFLEVFPVLESDSWATSKGFIESLSTRETDPERHELNLRTSRGTHIPIVMVAIPVWSETRDFIGVVVVFNDISEAKHAQVEQQRLVDTLVQRNGDLEQIIFIISHDLRAPLVSIKGFSGLLKAATEDLAVLLRGGSIASEVEEAVSRIVVQDIPKSLQYLNSGVDQMESLLSALLQLSRVGLAALDIQPLAMNDLLGQIVESQQYQVSEAAVQVSIAKLPDCRGDQQQISLVFANLLDNALKYLDPARPGVVEVTGKQTGRWVEYCIEDNGVGIAPEHREQIFKLFHRLKLKAVTGEGLGLAIVQRIIERHEGKVRVESEPGVGSKFFVTLPA